MNASELAEKMLLWGKIKHELDSLGAEIESEVLKLRSTQVVGDVRVTYSSGRSTYDYETPGKYAPVDIIDKHTTEYTKTNWDALAVDLPDIVEKYTYTEKLIDYRSVCKDAKIEPITLSKTEPTARIKIEE